MTNYATIVYRNRFSSLYILIHSFFLQNLPLQVFGCTSFVHIHHNYCTKLDPKSLKCIVLGYSPNKKGYKFYSPIPRKVCNSMDVTFLETNLSFQNLTFKGRLQRNIRFGISFKTLKHLSIHQIQSLIHSLSLSMKQIQPRFSFPQSQSTQILHNLAHIILLIFIKDVCGCTEPPFGNYVAYWKLLHLYRAFVINLDSVKVPNSIQEALKGRAWKKAIEVEI
ncbi:Retrovirus-related Pol polyprotein from transposon TNT 1-94 [Gossypium australe]|uniref:Retrovirus-related Pol polyprotein from transposon TNT 1-94 n=1 Tax=Gossypium australe TaxID=47621 RepID=A0A5B6V965_9ROSI|nr:Retrovirus-related Pol polyprotein from transposon TNT 1-94 [Gossypium australe]